MKTEHQYLLEIRLWPAAGQRERLFPGPRHFCPQAPAYGPGHKLSKVKQLHYSKTKQLPLTKLIQLTLKPKKPFLFILNQNKTITKGIQFQNYKTNTLQKPNNYIITI